MAIEAIGLDQIHDNPYQARLTYHRKDIDELAHSIKTHGLLQVPPGRRKDGDIELGFGHLRKRAFANLAKKEPEKWGKMPIDIRDISDEQMAMFSLEENLKRRDISPLETARAVDKYLVSFPGKTEIELAESLNMAKGTVSNMKRVLRLPEKMLGKIDEGIISFHQGRELLIFERFENAENLMRSALDGLKIGNKVYGEPNTVDGLQKSIHRVISGQCRPLDKEWQGYRWDLLFDTRATGCLECDKMIRTHPTKSATAHYCTDAECWDRHQEEHREKAAAEAKARMQAEIINRAATSTAEPLGARVYRIQNQATKKWWEGLAASPEAALAKAGWDKEDCWVSVRTERGGWANVNIPQEKAPAAPVMIDENTILVDQETFAKIEASYSGDRISEGTAVRRPVEFEGKLYVATSGSTGEVAAYQLVPREEFTGKVRTYTVPKERESDEYYESLRNDPNGFYHGMLVKRGKEAHVLVGPEVTFITKVDEGDFSQEKSETNLERPVGELPCDTCAKGNTCDRTFFHVADDNSGRLVCDVWECDHVSWAVPLEQREAIPEEVLAQAKEAAGTRAEVLDIHPLYSDQWRRDLKSGYALLNDVINQIDDPQECLERCTRGFHYAFDSGHPDRRQLAVCTDPKCVAKKKAAFTRAKNAEGQSRKKAEMKAVKEAVAQTTTLDRPRIKLILLTQMEGIHVRDYYFGGIEAKKPSKWLWDKVSAGTPENDRTRGKLFKVIDKLSDEDLSKLVVEMMFYYLMDHGDIGHYEIKTEDPLKWLGVKIELLQETEVVEGEDYGNRSSQNEIQTREVGDVR